MFSSNTVKNTDFTIEEILSDLSPMTLFLLILIDYIGTPLRSSNRDQTVVI